MDSWLAGTAIIPQCASIVFRQYLNFGRIGRDVMFTLIPDWGGRGFIDYNLIRGLSGCWLADGVIHRATMSTMLLLDGDY